LIGLQEVALYKSACGYSTTETAGLRCNRQPPGAAEEYMHETRRQWSSTWQIRRRRTGQQNPM